jgi:Tol biopolymer transport system component
VVSSDGAFIAFASAGSDLVAGDTNRQYDVFVLEVATGIVERVSIATDGTQGNGQSAFPAISADGRFVAFTSYATNLTPDAAGTDGQCFVRDRLNGTTEMVSVDSAGVAGKKGSGDVAISADGRLVAFESNSDNLVAGDRNGQYDVFVRDRSAGTTSLVSVNADGSQGDRLSITPFISEDGRFVAFFSRAKDFPDYCDDGASGDLEQGVWVKDLTTGELERADVDSDGLVADCVGGLPAGVSADGNLILFNAAGSYDAGDDNGELDAYVRDRAAGTTERVSVGAKGVWPDPAQYASSLSPDGRFVAYQSRDGSIVEDDTNDEVDVFLFDRLTRITSRISIASDDTESPNWSRIFLVSGGSVISADGRIIVFSSGGTLSSSDDNTSDDVYLRARSRTEPTTGHYGNGFPGRDGTVPTMSSELPYRGARIRVDVSNSSRFYVAAFVFVGVTRDAIKTSLGGELLLDPLLVFPIPLAPFGGSFEADVPTAWWANGLAVDLQTLELDPWAAKGVSFTDGFELVLGDG